LSEISVIALALSGSLTVAYVRNPFLANRSDVSNPIPLELPVTTAIFSSAIFICQHHANRMFLSLLSLVTAFGFDQKAALSIQNTHNKW
jgi:hypothetical protein